MVSCHLTKDVDMYFAVLSDVQHVTDVFWESREVPCKASKEVIEGSKDGYPELEEKKDFIFKVLTRKKNQFNKTIDQGLRILADMEEEMKEERRKIFPEKMHSNCMILMDSLLILQRDP